MTAPATLTVLFCRPDSSTRSATGDESTEPGRAGASAAPADHPKAAAAFNQIRRALGEPANGASIGGGRDINYVGRRPGKAIDGLLAGRVLVVGDDADLAAVELRLLRKDLLGAVEVAYVAPRRTPFTQLWDLPTGPGALAPARQGEADLIPLARDDVGGVLVAVGHLGPVNGTVYVDEKRVLQGAAHRLSVRPDRDKGLAVTVEPRRLAGFGMFARRRATTLGRAVQIGTMSTTVVRDGIPYPRSMDRWTFYKHTEPLRLIRGLF